MEIKGKVFVISGAASGLGRATAEYLINRGARIIALDISSGNLEVLQTAFPDAVRPFTVDVRKQDEISEALKISFDEWGRIDGGIACAGVAPGEKIFSRSKGSHSGDTFEKVIGINLTGTFNLLNASVPYMIRKEEKQPGDEMGVFIATASVAAFEGQIGQVAYAASKGGISSMILPAARELAGLGIRVIAIAPGIFKTPMVEGFSKTVQQSLAQQIPFPSRLGNPGEFAQLVETIFTNQMINGTVIRLDGAVRMGSR